MEEQKISLDKIKSNLKTKILGSKIKIVETIDSTNTYLKENDCINGEVLIALMQLKGRGRRERTFVSDLNKGIYFSYAINISKQKISNITICVAVSIVCAIENICGIKTDIKWVNDIFFHNKKLAGILTEIVNYQKKAIVGIGINTEKVKKEIEQFAISIKDIICIEDFESALISEILNCFEYFFYSEDFEKVLRLYREKLFFLNKEIIVKSNVDYIATAIDINESGELIVKDKDGVLKTLNCGEISIKATYNFDSKLENM